MFKEIKFLWVGQKDKVSKKKKCQEVRKTVAAVKIQSER